MKTLIRSLNRLFNLQTAEWPQLLFLYAMAFLFVLGITWGGLSVEAAFLIEVGVENLPYIIVANAIVSIVAVAIYTPFVDRVANDRLLIYVTLASAIPIGIGRLLLQSDQPAVTDLAYQVLYLLTIVVRQVFNLQWWTYVNSFYDTRAAKRIVPVLITAPRIAIIIAGQTIGLLNATMTSRNIIWLWTATLLAVASLAWLMPRVLKTQKVTESKSRPAATDRGTERQSFLRNVQEGYRYVFRSPYLRCMALSALLLMILLALLEFRASQIFAQPGNFASPKALSGFLGQLSAWSSLLLLPFQLFLFSHLVTRLGLGNANLIFPTGTLAACAALIARPGVVTAALAYVDRKILFRVFRNPTHNLLYNAVPLRVKGRARAFIGGLVAPAGSLVGGLLLLMPIRTTAWFLSALIGMTSLAYVVANVILRQQYARALVTLLEQEDFASLFATVNDTATDIRVTDAKTLRWLTQKLHASTSSDFTIFMTQIISEVGGDRAVPALADVLRTTDEATVRAAIVDVLAASSVRTGDAAQLYERYLDDADGRVRRAAIAALERWAGSDSERFLAPALDLLDDPHIDVRAQVIPALAQAGDFFYMASAVQALTQLLEDEDPERRARGVRVLGQIGDVRFIRNLAPYLADEWDQVRLQAALAIESLAQAPMPEPVIRSVMAHLPPLLHDPVERVRRAALNILAHIDSPQAHQMLVHLLTDASPRVREAATGALADVGQPVVPLLTPALQAQDPQLRKMATIVLSRIDRERFGDHVIARIDDTLQAVYLNISYGEALSSYAEHDSIAALQSMLHERNARLTEEIFHLLAAIHEPEAIDVVADTLASDVDRVRANAVEALESLTDPQTAQLIAPMFDPGSSRADLQRIGEATWDIGRCEPAETIRHLVSDPNDPWMRAAMTFSLGEIGAALARSEERSDQPQELDEKPTSLSSRAAAIFDGLHEEIETGATSANQDELLESLIAPSAEGSISPAQRERELGQPADSTEILDSLLGTSTRSAQDEEEAEETP